MKTLILDTETGGLSPYTDGLCSIALKEHKKGDTLKIWYIKPKRSKFYSYRALKINGLDLDTLESCGKPLREVLDILQLNYLNETKVRIIGHNIEFDLKFLMQSYKDEGIKLPIIEYYCTMDLANDLLKKEKLIKSVSLSSVFDYFFPGDDLLKGAHRAENDVVMTEMIFDELMKMELEKNAETK